jgi:hypothetical protein
LSAARGAEMIEYMRNIRASGRARQQIAELTLKLGPP